MTVWDKFRDDEYIGLAPWTSLELVSVEPRCPFPYLGGVAPEVVTSLHEAHGLLRNAVEDVVGEVLCRGIRQGDPSLRPLMEDAYAEVVHSRAHLRAHIQCGREPDGRFRWEFPLDHRQSATVTFTGLAIGNTVTKGTTSFEFDRPILPGIGKVLGSLDGTSRVGEVRATVAAFGPDLSDELERFLEVVNQQECLTASTCASVGSQWLSETRDRDVVHLGHAGLLYRQQDRFFLFDPWLMPWYAAVPVPSLCHAVLPRPAALFLTHEHDDHMNSRTLLQMPKHIPVIVPSQRNGRALYYDYPSILRELGFQEIIELAHGERWTFDGGAVEAVPFYGEDPCDLQLPRNCYVIADRGRNTLVQADTGPSNDGRSAVKDGIIDDLVRRYGPIATIFASQQQTREVRGQSGYAYLSHPGRWLETGESTSVNLRDCVRLAASTKARLFVSYATGGADWFPEHVAWLIRPGKPARNALTTVTTEPLEKLEEPLKELGCRYHYSYALDLYRETSDGGTAVVAETKALDPLRMFERDHGDHPLLQKVREGRQMAES